MPAVSIAKRTLPSCLEPQLCSVANEPPAGDGWLHEIKYDGWRLLARKAGKGVRLFTRGGHECSSLLPEIAASIRGLDVRSVWFDGELVYLDEDGYPSFDRLLRCVRRSDEARLFYHVWDVPWRNARGLCDQPLIERKQRLAELFVDPPTRVRYTAHVLGRGADFFAAASETNLEGIVSKRVESVYAPGQRTRDWLKVKCWRTYHLVVGGVQCDSDGNLTSLLVGSWDADGSLRYEGRVELGLYRIRRALSAAQATRVSPFRDRLEARGAMWLRPDMMISVRALPRRAGSALRHAIAVRAFCPEGPAGRRWRS